MDNAEKDFVELLRLFNKHEVRYCIVGAYAVGYYALPRFTKDLDLLVEPALPNGERICRALKEFGFGSLSITPQDFDRPGRIIQLGYEPFRIDLITSVSGVTFVKVWKNKKRSQFGGQKAYFIGLADLIKSKKAAGRTQDLSDLEILEKLKAPKTHKKP